MKSTFSVAKNLSFMALFASLTCVCTLTIQIPLPAGGYFNVGDVFVLLSAWCLGPLYGAIAAGVGGSLADLVSGYAIYAPATLLIKAVVAALSYILWKSFKNLVKNQEKELCPRTVSAILGELFMVVGYFLYDAMLYGFAGATVGLIGNAMQGVCCALLAVFLLLSLCKIKAFKNYFPLLKK